MHDPRPIPPASPRADGLMIRGQQIFSGEKEFLEQAAFSGTPPFLIASTSLNANLNADLWDGFHAQPVLDFYNGTILEQFDATVASNGTVITLSLEKTGTGDLTMRFSDGESTLDCTPADTITLTAGSDSSPQGNWIYVLQSGKVLAKDESAWPTTEHIKIAYILCQSAASLQTQGGPYINQNWNDSAMGSDSQGHMSHIAENLRTRRAGYFSGVDGNGVSDYLTFGAGNTEFASTSGVVSQLHKHTFPAFDTSSGDEIHVKNWFGDSYHALTDLFDIDADSTGASIGNNKWFNLVFWGVANKSGAHHTVMVNLPGGFYNTQSAAEQDVSGYDDFTIPREFSIDSSTGFLIARVTLKMAATWVFGSTVDLRGKDPQTAAGGAAATISSFPDNAFSVFNVLDNTKIVVIDAGNITAANTRTITMADQDIDLAATFLFANGTVALSGPWNMGSQNLTNVNIDSGTVDGITSLTVANDVDIGPHELRAETFHSDVPLGTAPFTIVSSTVVPNLNADRVDGLGTVDFLLVNGTQGLTADIDFGSFDIRAQTVTPDSLTSGRIVFTSTNGLLVDSADGTVDGTRWTFGREFRLTGIPSGAGAADVRIAGDGDFSFLVSARWRKQDIQPWLGDSSGIFDLVPVTCRMRDDVRKYGDGAPTVLCYIADDSVDMIDYLIARDNNGDVFSIDYKLLTVPIIQELKKQRDENISQARRITDLETRLADLEGG